MLTATLPTATKNTYVDTTRSKPIDQAQLVQTKHQPVRYLEFNPHIADLMLAIRAGRPTVITKSSTRQDIASFAWKTAAGAWNSFFEDNERYCCQSIEKGTHVFDIDTPNPWSSLVDKLISAIKGNCYIHTRLIDGAAVLSWDRSSHGNTPTIVLYPNNLIANYYNWPSHLPEHLEPKETPYHLHPNSFEHVKPFRPAILPYQPATQQELFKAGHPDLAAQCRIEPCTTNAPNHAVDPRNTAHGPLCNYHLYGPNGYLNTRQPYQEFANWLSKTNSVLADMNALELHAELRRARDWSHADQGNAQ